ncbi:erythropoietin receptor-like isoform X1 [Anguilla anguilla]|uniref:erythropoietin receptor-like isoform X1 n=1 Tax=Anguilla anguilla TaxID=7936 RepID=UPI0015B018A3|nr:erythropoietin receptor-like isoform X1 [Anguilla anguilla]
MSKVPQLYYCGLFIFFYFQNGFFAQSDRDLETKVALLLNAEPADLKCFASGKYDLTCFWEGNVTPEEYTFKYTYQNEQSMDCAVRAQPVGGGKTRYFCKLSKVLHFFPLDLHVFRAGEQIFNRSILVDRVFLLDPPANLTMTRTGKPGQLKLTWLPPPLKYMDDSMMYEVNYFAAGSPMGKRELVKAQTETTLRGLQPGTRYEARVRVKFDGTIYDGYWSAWTPTVSMETPHRDTDPLILSLCLVISFILMVLCLSVLLSRRRFLLKKMWPLVPSPENKFPDLFTVYGGDFQAWLVHSTGGLGWRFYLEELFYLEEHPAPLEVLSEASIGSAVPACAAPSRALRTTGAEGEEEEGGGGRVDAGLPYSWKEKPQERWLFEQLRPLPCHPLPPFGCAPLESKDAYVILNQDSQRDVRQGPPDDVSEESVPLQVLFTSPGTPTSQSDLGSFRNSSGTNSRLSSQSSYEDSHNPWQPKVPGYAYLTIADSGIYMDYSPMSSGRTVGPGTGGIYANEYENEIPPHGLPHSGRPIHSEC